MKYHEKLNLKSPFYKLNNINTSKTPNKSPIKQSINPNDFFQKVCCPNCKYDFNIIKTSIIKQCTPEISKSPAKKIKIKEKKQIETQTQFHLSLNNHYTALKTLKSQSKLSGSYNPSLAQDLTSYQLSQLNQRQKYQKLWKQQTIESQFKFKPHSQSPDNKIDKPKNLLKTLNLKKFQIFQSDQSAGTKEFPYKQFSNQYQHHQKNYNNEKEEKMKFDNNFQEKNERCGWEQNRGIEKATKLKQKHHNHFLPTEPCCKCKNSAQIELLIKQIIMRYNESEGIIKQLLVFCQDICQQIEMPSFCKMLAFSSY